MAKYIVPRSNVGKGGIFKAISGVRYHVPSWTVVDEDTTLDDIEVEAKPFAELFEEPKEEKWEFISERTGEKYYVRYNVRSCSCWGYISHRKCKHIKKVKEEVGNTE